MDPNPTITLLGIWSQSSDYKQIKLPKYETKLHELFNYNKRNCFFCMDPKEYGPRLKNKQIICSWKTDPKVSGSATLVDSRGTH